MDIIGVAVRDVAEGREITITAIVRQNGALDGSEVPQLLDLLDQMNPEGEVSRDTAQEPEAPTRRRSRASAQADGSATSQPSAPAAASAEAPASEGRRRRRGSVEAAPANPPAEAPRRRRGSDGAAAGSAAGTAPQAAPTAEPTRRRRTGNAAPAEEISDQDLVKGASEAADELTPALVMQILAEDFNGAKLVTDLHGADRRKFLDTLKEEIEAQARDQG